MEVLKNLSRKFKSMLTNFVRMYLECMQVYGEGLLKGGSYGC